MQASRSKKKNKKKSNKTRHKQKQKPTATKPLLPPGFSHPRKIKLCKSRHAAALLKSSRQNVYTRCSRRYKINGRERQTRLTTRNAQLYTRVTRARAGEMKVPRASRKIFANAGSKALQTGTYIALTVQTYIHIYTNVRMHGITMRE